MENKKTLDDVIRDAKQDYKSRLLSSQRRLQELREKRAALEAMRNPSGIPKTYVETERAKRERERRETAHHIVNKDTPAFVRFQPQYGDDEPCPACHKILHLLRLDMKDGESMCRCYHCGQMLDVDVLIQ